MPGPATQEPRRRRCRGLARERTPFYPDSLPPYLSIEFARLRNLTHAPCSRARRGPRMVCTHQHFSPRTRRLALQLPARDHDDAGREVRVRASGREAWRQLTPRRKGAARRARVRRPPRSTLHGSEVFSTPSCDASTFVALCETHVVGHAVAHPREGRVAPAVLPRPRESSRGWRRSRVASRVVDPTPQVEQIAGIELLHGRFGSGGATCRQCMGRYSQAPQPTPSGRQGNKPRARARSFRVGTLGARSRESRICSIALGESRLEPALRPELQCTEVRLMCVRECRSRCWWRRRSQPPPPAARSPGRARCLGASAPCRTRPGSSPSLGGQAGSRGEEPLHRPRFARHPHQNPSTERPLARRRAGVGAWQRRSPRFAPWTLRMAWCS